MTGSKIDSAVPNDWLSRYTIQPTSSIVVKMPASTRKPSQPVARRGRSSFVLPARKAIRPGYKGRRQALVRIAAFPKLNARSNSSIALTVTGSFDLGDKLIWRVRPDAHLCD